MKAWYGYFGEDGEDPMDVSHYHILQKFKRFCLCGPRLCCIYVDFNGDHPAPLSENMRNYIEKALATELMQPDIPYDAKKYVYLS